MIPLPPKLEHLMGGTKLNAGLGTSTILADFDFETYSESGFVWNSQTNKFDPPTEGAKKGLSTVGTAVYSEHPSTEVLSMAYDLKDGNGKRLWKPGDMPPLDLFRYLKHGGLLEAWNVPFERWIWVNVCQLKYGFPPIPFDQLRCAMAKARAFGLPGSLDAAGNVMDIKNKKDKDGKRLIDLFSIPRNPTIKDKRIRITPNEDLTNAQLLYLYNLQDIAAECEISSLTPDLTDSELDFWLCDQAINFRGVQLDTEMVAKCRSIVEQAHDKYNTELQRLTNGRVQYASEIQKIRSWLMDCGVSAPTLDDGVVTDLLKLELHPNVRRVLQIRQLIGSAAVKKLYSMSNQVTKSGRVHDLFIYHSARTGRAAGTGPQPQNLPNSGPEIAECLNCTKHYGINAIGNVCPWCAAVLARPVEWNPKAVECAFETIASGNLECVEYYWGNAIEIISGCLRGLLISKPGYDLICSDYSAIEGVVLAELAGEKWRQEVFRTHGRIYESSASKITGIPIEKMIEHKKLTGKHHESRKLGKVAELACFDKGTIILTKRGYIPIVKVLITDELWDGIEWVKHQGVILKGQKKTINLDGIKVTPSHPIYLGNEYQWENAEAVNSNEQVLNLALEIGSENLPLLEKKEREVVGIKYWLDVIVEKLHISLIFLNYKVIKVWSVGIAQLKTKIIHPPIKTSFPMLNCEHVPFLEYMEQSRDVTIQKIPNTQTMVDVVSKFVKNGEKEAVNEFFYNTLLLLKTGIVQKLKWTVSMLMGIMNPAISVLFPEKIIKLIKEKLTILKERLHGYENVYDIVNAGPLNRFTIKTNSGHLIVHNSGYQGWIGAWKQFGADEFFNDDQIKEAVLAWRKASPAIVEMWGGQIKDWYSDYYGLEGMAVLAVMNPGFPYVYRGITYLMQGDVLYCQLLSGRYLTYHRPRLTPSTRKQDTYSLSFEGWNTNPKNGGIGWIRMYTYGGKLTENVVQATARDILAHAIVNLEKRGYPVVLHVHDEIVAEIPENTGSIAEFEEIMSTLPSWCAGWPVKASGGWRAKRYAK